MAASCCLVGGTPKTLERCHNVAHARNAAAHRQIATTRILGIRTGSADVGSVTRQGSKSMFCHNDLSATIADDVLLANLQGNILRGYRRLRATYVLFRFKASA